MIMDDKAYPLCSSFRSIRILSFLSNKPFQLGLSLLHDEHKNFLIVKEVPHFSDQKKFGPLKKRNVKTFPPIKDC